MNLMIPSKKYEVGEGIFGYDEIPSFELINTEMPVKLHIDFSLPENINISGESIIFEVDCDVSYPIHIGNDKYSVNSYSLKEQVRILTHEKLSPVYMQLFRDILPFFFFLWFIGLIIIYKRIKNDPY